MICDKIAFCGVNCYLKQQTSNGQIEAGFSQNNKKVRCCQKVYNGNLGTCEIVPCLLRQQSEEELILKIDNDIECHEWKNKGLDTGIYRYRTSIWGPPKDLYLCIQVSTLQGDFVRTRCHILWLNIGNSKVGKTSLLKTKSTKKHDLGIWTPSSGRRLFERKNLYMHCWKIFENVDWQFLPNGKDILVSKYPPHIHITE